ncbi:forkhead box protein J1-A-like [Parambassis ranga]|uniref:Forkhead box protein J1-A-like n=1 Tax=Parambassis ranga TaxID=210632 RepID=A0A6P7IPM4_9TELE|nr:forkhead box protein J1-A-like [Parambassis ranga]
MAHGVKIKGFRFYGYWTNFLHQILYLMVPSKQAETERSIRAAGWDPTSFYSQLQLTQVAQAEERDSVVMDNSSISSSCSSVNQDDSLTSLQWLQEFSIPGANVPQHAHHQPHLFGHQLVGSNAPSFPLAGDPASIRMPLTLEELTAAAYSRMQSLPGIVAYGHCPDEVDYKTNAHIKPPYSYATLICMAMQASKESKFNLPYIYKWITDNFCYYRHSDSNWQNSIRYNLSFNKCFIKVPRQKGDPGKGGFWKIDPHYAERLLSGTYKHRQMPPVRIHHALQNSLQPQSTGPCSTTGVQEGLCINPESQQRLQEIKEETLADWCSDRHLAEGTMQGSWPVVRGGDYEPVFEEMDNFHSPVAPVLPAWAVRDILSLEILWRRSDPEGPSIIVILSSGFQFRPWRAFVS